MDPCYSLGLIVLVALGGVGLRLWRTGLSGGFEEQDAIDPVPLPPLHPKRDEGPEHVGFAAIRHADPHFDLDRFYARVSEMFVAYHEAVDRGDLKPVRRFIDERYYADLLRELGRREALPGAPEASSGPLAVEHARAMTATHEAGMDQVRVLITAHGGAGGGQHVQEYWTLIRRQGAITKADLSLYKCPNCGAPTDGEDPTRCGYCGARLADPALDWVVDSIRAD